MRKIAHIIKDDKFFDALVPTFESLKNFENIYVLKLNSENYGIKYIKNVDKVVFVYSDTEILQKTNDADIIYFHSFSSLCYKLALGIAKDKIVIAWFWGYDIYNTEMIKGVIDIELYKPITKLSTKQQNKLNVRNFLRKIYYFFKRRYIVKLRERAFLRLDYCMPVLRYEYDIINKNSFFNAEYFSLPRLKYYPNFSSFNSERKNILLGNSATPTNNHLDVLELLKTVESIEDRSIILPLNYGNDSYRGYLKLQIEQYNYHKLYLLESFLPIDEYNDLINSCSHAIFAHIRQQAIYNIMYCLRNGIKVFLYKDSVAYHQFKNIDGYFLYSIENDLNSKELSLPLTKEEAIHNLEVYNKSGFSSVEEREVELNRIFSLFDKKC